MKNKCYINGMGCVSAQQTFDEEFLSSPIDYSENNVIRVVKPDYKSVIPPAAIRRMSSAVKNSIVASNLAIQAAENKQIDAIITGTGLGCIQDSEKFLNNLIDNNEQYLTPTSFIQSTHNTVAGQIALGIKCKAYNVTYVNAGASFPSALLDAQLFIASGEKKNILIGGVDELSDYTTHLFQLIHHYKKEEDVTGDILNKRTVGHIPGEGAAFFALSRKIQNSTCAEIVDVNFSNQVPVDKLNVFLKDFLERNQLNFEQIDTIILGNSGDIDHDVYYDEAQKHFQTATPVYFKHLFGEMMTSSAIALWLGAKILKSQVIPSMLLKHAQKTNSIKNILIYNQYRGKDHSLILLKNV